MSDSKGNLGYQFSPQELCPRWTPEVWMKTDMTARGCSWPGRVQSGTLLRSPQGLGCLMSRMRRHLADDFLTHETSEHSAVRQTVSPRASWLLGLTSSLALPLWMGFNIDRTLELSRHMTVGCPGFRAYRKNTDPEGSVSREFCPQRTLMACMVIPTWGALDMDGTSLSLTWSLILVIQGNPSLGLPGIFQIETSRLGECKLGMFPGVSRWESLMQL